MRTTPRFTGFALLMIALASAFGCQSTETKQSQGEFLSNYARLGPSTVSPGALAYRNPSLGTRSFGAVNVEPVAVAYSSDSQRQMADTQREAEVKKYLAAKLTESLSARLSSTAGAPNLRVRSAITDVDPARTSGTFQATVGPAATATGRGTLEVEMIDAKSGEVVFAFIDRRNNVRPSGPQQVEEAKRQVDEAIARMMAELDGARSPR